MGRLFISRRFFMITKEKEREFAKDITMPGKPENEEVPI
jgi:hypothetical protein